MFGNRIPNDNMYPYGRLQYILHQLNLDWLVKQVNKNTEDIKELQEEGGTSAYASVTKSGDTATITCTDANGTTTATVSDGQNGQDGTDGTDGTSAYASVTKSGGTATITCTDANGTTTATVSDGKDGQNGADGADGVGVPAGGTAGQVLAKASGTDYDTEWTTPSGGGGLDSDVIADEFGGTPSSYSAGDTCMYNSTRYECTGATGGTWDSSKWSQIVVDTVEAWGGSVAAGHYIVYNGSYYKNTSSSSQWYSGGTPTSPFVLKTFPNYVTETTANYSVGDFVMYNGSLYRCTGATTSASWDATKWTLTQVMDEAGCVVPSGGTTGQVLTKHSNTNYDLEWTTPSGGGLTTYTLTPLNNFELDYDIYGGAQSTSWAAGYQPIKLVNGGNTQYGTAQIADASGLASGSAGVAIIYHSMMGSFEMINWSCSGGYIGITFNQSLEGGDSVLIF